MVINWDIINRTVGIASFILSLGGAAFSWQQASKAKKIKDEIADDRIKQTGRDLIALANSARDIIQKTRPLNSEKNMRGFSTEDSINSIQPFINKLNDTMHLFSNEQLLKEFITLQKQFSKYEKETDFSKITELRKTVIDSLNKIMSELNKILDENH